MNREATILISLTIAAITLFGCSKSVRGGDGEDMTLDLAYITLPQAGLVHIALAKDYFKAEGLSVRAHPFAFGKPAVESMLKGESDLALSAETPIIFATLAGEDIGIAAVLETADKTTAIESFGICANPFELADFEFTVDKLPDAIADRSMMQRVWENLLSNAVKYSMPSPAHKIEVRGALQDGMAVYSVEDHGSGFDQRYAGKLFNLFQRLHGSDEFHGTGVGLSIVKSIVEKHGGTVWAEGRVGLGAKFSFSIPSEANHGHG